MAAPKGFRFHFKLGQENRDAIHDPQSQRRVLQVLAAKMTTFTITMRAKPNVDPIKALRGAIKVLGRYYGFRILQIDEIKENEMVQARPACRP
jgi:hypothetical protein